MKNHQNKHKTRKEDFHHKSQHIKPYTCKIRLFYFPFHHVLSWVFIKQNGERRKKNSCKGSQRWYIVVCSSVHLILLYTTYLFAKPPFNLLVIKIFHSCSSPKVYRWLFESNFHAGGEAKKYVVLPLIPPQRKKKGSINIKNCTWCMLILWINIAAEKVGIFGF